MQSWAPTMLDASLSARRAWIEIKLEKKLLGVGDVALRKESVDRNWMVLTVSPPQAVALRKESVDRNISPHSISCMILSRSPQGERG